MPYQTPYQSDLGRLSREGGQVRELQVDLESLKGINPSKQGRLFQSKQPGHLGSIGNYS